MQSHLPLAHEWMDSRPEDNSRFLAGARNDKLTCCPRMKGGGSLCTYWRAVRACTALRAATIKRCHPEGRTLARGICFCSALNQGRKPKNSLYRDQATVSSSKKAETKISVLSE